MKNEYKFCKDYGIIYIKKNDETTLKMFVDNADLVKLSLIKGTIRIDNHNYAVYQIDGKTRFVHRLIMKCPDGFCVDHINHNKLDNRKSNLRIITHEQNSQNRVMKEERNKSGYRGVCWNSEKRKWMAYAKHVFCGYFDSVKEAAIAARNGRDRLMEYSVN